MRPPPRRLAALSFDQEFTVSRRGGSADLPLHGGRVPAWRGQRMPRFGNEQRSLAMRRRAATAQGPSVESRIAQDQPAAHRCGGRSGFGWAPVSVGGVADAGGALPDAGGVAAPVRVPAPALWRR